MSNEQKSSPLEVLLHWAGMLPTTELRWGSSGDTEGEVDVRIGDQAGQALELRIRPATRWGELTGSQFVERFSNGEARFTTPWDDQWTAVEPPGDGFEAWLARALSRVVGAHLMWDLEAVFADHDEGRRFLRLCRELVEVQAMGPETLSLDDALTSLLPIAQPLLQAAEGSKKAVRRLVKLSKQDRVGLEQRHSVRSLLVGAGSRCLSGEALGLFEDKMQQSVAKDARRVVEASGVQPGLFRELKIVMDHATPGLHDVISREVDQVFRTSKPGSEADRELQARIVRYNEIFRDWQHYNPTCKNPMQAGLAFIELEGTINASWRKRLDDAQGLMRPTMEARLVSEGRFLSGAHGCVTAWLRAREHYDLAVELTCALFSDLELVVLQHGSQTLAFENMVNNALGAFLDSGDEEHIRLGVEILEKVDPLFSWVTGLCDYQVACVYARAAMVEKSLEALGRSRALGKSISRATRDSDLAAIHDHPTLLRWIAEDRE